MNRSYLLKKKALSVLSSFGIVLLKILVKTYKFIFAKRTILFVTKKKIRSVTLGPIVQICIVLFFAWVYNMFNQSIHYGDILDEKAEEIKRLQAANNYFREEFNETNEKLRKINDYLISVTGSTNQKVSDEEKPKLKTPKNVKEDQLSNDDQHTLNEIRDTNYIIADIHSFARTRINKIENAISLTGLNLKTGAKSSNKTRKEIEKVISLNSKKELRSKQGGPIGEVDAIDANIPYSAEDALERQLEKAEFVSDLDRLKILEKLVKVMPFSRPMRNYYISSGFGGRVDPITGSHASHKGLDFAGPANEKIISPSNGKVVMAGPFSGYGNAIVIDHGFGITTRYGHLASVKVHEGQIVKKGEVIAIQGNTGRSTGSHLHYEVRYRNTPLNPKKFIEAGDTLFKDGKAVKYVNS